MGRVDLYLAIEKMLEEHGSEEIQPVNVVASLHIDYLAEITLLHNVTIETWVEKIGNKSMTVGQTLYADGTIAAKVTAVLVGIDPQTKQTISYPKNWEPTK